jgi:hypothetical protein
MPTAVDQGALNTATSYAQNAAQQAYNNAKLNLETEQQAFTEAQTAYQNALSIATTFGTSPGGTYNGQQLPSQGTPTMAQANQWASLYGTAAAPANPYQMTLGAQQQQFNQQQAAQQNYAGLSGYYTPQQGIGTGTMGAGVSVQNINQAMQNALGNGFNQSLFQQMTSGLQGQNMTTPQAMQQVNAAIQAASQGKMQSYGDIAGAVGALSGGQAYSSSPTQQQTLAAQAQNAGLTGMTTYQPYQSGTWLYDPQAGTYGQVSDNGQVRTFTDLNSAKQAGMPTADWAGGQVDPARVVQTSSQGNWGGIGSPMSTMQMQQQQFNQALQTAQFQQGTAQSYLNLLSQLQGPADYGQYLKVLGSTPQGIQSLVNAASGQYIPGAGATTGTQPQAQTLQSLVGSATSGVGGGQNPFMTTGNTATGGVAGGYGGQAQGPGTDPYAAAGAAGSASAGQQNPSSQPLASQAPGSAPAGTGSGGGTSYAQFMQQARGLPAPNQLAPQSYNAMTDSQKQVLNSMYSQLGYSQNDIASLYSQSLPKYAAGGGVQTGSFKLQ